MMDCHFKIKPMQNNSSAYRLLHEGTLALARAERAGMRIDMEYCERVQGELGERIETLEKEFYSTKFFRRWQHSQKSKINIDSGQQLASYLYHTLKLTPPASTESGKGSADEESLGSFDIPELNLLLKIRKLKKVKSTYMEAFMREQVNGYIHPSFNLHLPTTYRSSSDHPNFQNMPKRDKETMKLVRNALFPRPGHQLMEIDTSGMEVRIAACYHKDPVMLKYIFNPTTDMHGDMAQQLFKVKKFNKSLPEHYVLRQAAKNGFVFPQFYGDYYVNCAKNLVVNWGKLTEGEWKKGEGISMPGGSFLSDHLISQGIKSFSQFLEHVRTVEKDFWGNRFMKYAQWKERWYKSYLKSGYVDMFTGFRCQGVMSRNDCINYPVQGAAFHCLLWAFIETDLLLRMNKMKSRLIGQIHDSLVLDVHPDEVNWVVYEINKIFTEKLPAAWEWIIVPIEVEVDLAPVDGSWAEMKEYKIQ